jgi:hypothetical protein
MKTHILYFALILSSCFTESVTAQDDVTLFNYWQYYSDAENSLYKYFCSTGLQQLQERKAVIDKLQTKEEWKKRQADVRKKLLDIIGPFPDKTPLNVRVTGTIQKEGFRVEKLIYESMPGYYVTAALFIPDRT